jgi:hypothetical protein
VALLDTPATPNEPDPTAHNRKRQFVFHVDDLLNKPVNDGVECFSFGAQVVSFGA